MEYKKESEKFSFGFGTQSVINETGNLTAIAVALTTVVLSLLKIKHKRKKKIFPKHFTK